MSRTSTAHLRVPPQNIDAEKALLGSIMLRPEVIHDVLDIVAAESFYSEQHRIVWRAIYELFGKNIPVDILSLSSRLSESSMLEKIGGSAYLGELVNFVPSAANAEFYATKIGKHTSELQSQFHLVCRLLLEKS